MEYGEAEVEPTDRHMPEFNEVLIADRIWFAWVPFGWAMLELCWYRWN